MECKIQCMGADVPEEVTIPEGKVESVCREWLVREDGVLAYKLQSEEIEHHYGHNKERSQLLRSDFQEAQTAQKFEEEEAVAMHLAYEKMLKEQEDHDALIAKQLQDKILLEDLVQQKKIEEEDQKIALELQRKEKLRLQRKREEKELKQAERARMELSLATTSGPIKTMEDSATSPLDKDVSLLSAEPPDDLTPDQFQKFIHSRDAELARLLQEQEMKSPGGSKQDQQLAIEAQDRELAKVLQEQERLRAKKARERARQKAAVGYQPEMTRPLGLQGHMPDAPSRETCTKERLSSPDWSPVDGCNFPGSSVNNIAAAIDPTYNGGNQSSYVLSPHNFSSNSPLSNDVPPYSPSSSVSDSYLMNEEDSEPAPPYMPIQGTRRTTSLEKKKSKKPKDGCKTQ
ncbi:coiled-coil domain-containing protein 50 [Parasteatoda tepidariorum]|uniref:coiled-coil domain-containing protein 50 n=1 Tax=Parasteatoda tepidariorum TaxID=114398 RepID=UPI00077FC321|nr:coiled-coil domain-containing protein 50 [Parasteatoda tepidariorum]